MHTVKHHLLRTVAALSAVLALTALPSSQPRAAPGAHGPSGEHLDSPATAAAAAGASPRLEASSEAFELVGTLYPTELSILVDRFATNEPVLDAQVEVETGAVKAKARFHADHGDYAIDDPAFLKAVSAPGEHALVFTIRAGGDADLLDGKLVIAEPAAADHGHEQARRWDVAGLGWPVAVAAGVAAMVGLAVVGTALRRRGRAVRPPADDAGAAT